MNSPVTTPPTALLLVVHEPPDHHPRVVATDPDAAAIKAAVTALRWTDITFVVLKRDDDNWIEGSGSLNPEDGLSARYMIKGKEHVSAHPPGSLDDIVALLQSYGAGDDRWRRLVEWD